MKVAFKSLIAAAAFIAAAGAHAATVTVTAGTTVYKGHTVSGGEQLTFSDDAVSLLNIFKAALTPAGAQITDTRDADGQLVSLATATAISALKVEDTTDEMNTIVSTGGLTATVPVQRGLSSGGSLTLTDLDVDLVSKKVFATVVGANGVGTLTHIAVWNIASVAGSTTVDTTPGGTAVSQLQVSGLSLTTGALDTIAKSLGLLNIGKIAVSSVSDFGSLAITLNSVPVAETPACSVVFKTKRRSSTVIDSNVTITNASSNPSSGWQVNWNYNKPTMLTAIKNAKISNMALKSYTAQPVAANASIPAGASTSFSFLGFANGGLPVLGEVKATVGGQTCSVVTQ